MMLHHKLLKTGKDKEHGKTSEEKPITKSFLEQKIVVIAKECGEKWIYPLTSIMGIEELKNDVEL